MSSSNSILNVSGLSKSFVEGTQERVVLDNLSLTLREGELVVLLGRSGSGKSTLLNLISGLDVPSAGTVQFGDTSLSTLKEEDRTLFRRKQIGFIFQSFNLIPTLTVLENVLLPIELSGTVSKAEESKAKHILDTVGLGDRMNSFPDVLSGGEQQRVAIARAIAHDPVLILADEPTGNLDFETAQTVLELLQHLIHDVNRTMLIATHDREIIELADRVFTLQRGVLKELDAENEALD